MLAMRWVLFCNPMCSVCLVLSLPSVTCVNEADHSKSSIRSSASQQLDSMHMQQGCSHIRAPDGIFILRDLAVTRC